MLTCSRSTFYCSVRHSHLARLMFLNTLTNEMTESQSWKPNDCYQREAVRYGRPCASYLTRLSQMPGSVLEEDVCIQYIDWTTTTSSLATLSANIRTFARFPFERLPLYLFVSEYHLWQPSTFANLAFPRHGSHFMPRCSHGESWF